MYGGGFLVAPAVTLALNLFLPIDAYIFGPSP